jgi:hypothetical protein
MHIDSKPYGPRVKVVSKSAFGVTSLEVRVYIPGDGWGIRGLWADALQPGVMEAADQKARQLRVKLLEGEAA